MVAIDPQNTLKVLQNLQTGVRILMRLCNQAKEMAERLLLPLVPSLKKITQKFHLESCRIIEMSRFKGCFKEGVLKPKDLKGNSVSSQVSYGVDEEDVPEPMDEEEEEDSDEEDENVPVAPALSQKPRGKTIVKQDPVSSEELEDEEGYDDDDEDGHGGFGDILAADSDEE